MNLFKFLSSSILISLLAACATAPATYLTIEKNTSNQKTTSSIQIQIDTSFLNRVFTANVNIPHIKRDVSLDNLDQALKTSFNTKFKAIDIDATTNIKGDSQLNPLVKQQLLLITADSYTSSALATGSGIRFTAGKWNGDVKWMITLVNLDQKPLTVWKAKTSAFDVSSDQCLKKLYSPCTDKFVDSVISQLRLEKLIK